MMGNAAIRYGLFNPKLRNALSHSLAAVNLLNGISVNGLGEVALDSQTIMNQNQNLMTIGNYGL